MVTLQKIISCLQLLIVNGEVTNWQNNQMRFRLAFTGSQQHGSLHYLLLVI